jgi:hypothetical protein
VDVGEEHEGGEADVGVGYSVTGQGSGWFECDYYQAWTRGGCCFMSPSLFSPLC